MRISVTQVSASLFSADVAVGLPVGHPLALAALRGDARNYPDSLADTIFGFLDFERPSDDPSQPQKTSFDRTGGALQWEPPTVEEGAIEGTDAVDGRAVPNECPRRAGKLSWILQMRGNFSKVPTRAVSLVLYPPAEFCDAPCFRPVITLSAEATSRGVQAVRLFHHGPQGRRLSPLRADVVSSTARQAVVLRVPAATGDGSLPDDIEVVYSAEPGSATVQTRFQRSGWLRTTGPPWAELRDLWLGLVSALSLLVAAALIAVRPHASQTGRDDLLLGLSPVVARLATYLSRVLLVLAGLTLFIRYSSAVSTAENDMLSYLLSRTSTFRQAAYPKLSGSLVILVAGLATVWPVVAHAAAQEGLEGRDAISGHKVTSAIARFSAVGVLAAFLVLVTASLVAATPAWRRWPSLDDFGQAGELIRWTGVAVLAAFLAAACVAITLGRRAFPLFTGTLAAVVVGTLTTLAPLNSGPRGWLAVMVHLVPVITAAISLTAFVLLLRSVFKHTENSLVRPSVGSVMRADARLVVPAIGLVVILLALGWKVSSFDGSAAEPSLYDFYGLATSLGTLCLTGALFVLVVGIDRAGRQDTTDGKQEFRKRSGTAFRARLTWHRRASIAFALLIAAPSTLQLFGPLPAAFLAFWSVVALGLFPRDAIERLVAHGGGYQSRRQQDERVAALVNSLTVSAPAESRSPSENGTNRPESASTTRHSWHRGLLTRVTGLTPASSRRASGTTPSNPVMTGPNVSRPRQGNGPASMALSGPRTGWVGGRVGALAGALLGLPWVALGAAQLPHPSLTLDPGALLVLCVQWSLALAHWPLVGFLFGYSFAFLRGHTGLQKGLTLLITLAVVPVLSLVTGSFTFSAAAVSVAQITAVCLPLGLAADWYTLSRAGYGWAQLQTLYRLRFLAGWGTAVAAAVAATLTVATTATLTQLGHELFTPPQVTKPLPLPTPTASTTDTPRPSTP
ncbi:hypothetical protein ACPPVT_11200 [Angustibacter sp. McL0619]|uniref:hypothetical protein n=1 Tax=Angustibacter sp. McL0619 TaxID=3415676 RepID=UPI003CF4765E